MNVQSAKEFISNRIILLEYDIKTLQEMILDLQTNKQSQRDAIIDYYEPKFTTMTQRKYYNKMNELLKEID